jgi:hypothetical protein
MAAFRDGPVTSGHDYAGVPRTYDTDGLRRRAACVCLRRTANDSKCEVLMINSLAKPGHLILPGGGIDPDELPCTAAVRESMEEAGVDAHHIFDACNGVGAGVSPAAVSLAHPGDNLGLATAKARAVLLSPRACCSPRSCKACIAAAPSAAAGAHSPVVPLAASVAAAPPAAIGAVPATGDIARCTCICGARGCAPSGEAGAAAADSVVAGSPTYPNPGPIPLGVVVHEAKRTRTHVFALLEPRLLPDGAYAEAGRRGRQWVPLPELLAACEVAVQAAAAKAATVPDAALPCGQRRDAAAAPAVPAAAAVPMEMPTPSEPFADTDCCAEGATSGSPAGAASMAQRPQIASAAGSGASACASDAAPKPSHTVPTGTALALMHVRERVTELLGLRSLAGAGVCP